MNLILDTNILLFALLKESTTRQLIVDSPICLYYPEIAFFETKKYQDMIRKRTGLSLDEYRSLLSRLIRNIQLVSTEQLQSNLDYASKLMQHIDPNDVVFVAAHLSISRSYIWSDDKRFQQIEIHRRCLTTAEVVHLFIDIRNKNC